MSKDIKKGTAPEPFVAAKEGQLPVTKNTDIIADIGATSNTCRITSMTMNELFDQTYEPRPSIIDDLLYTGVYIFVGSPKIGKSFMMAQVGYHVANGMPLWGYQVRKGKVLYLALEDDYGRLQKRLAMMFGERGTDSLDLAIQARTLDGGLLQHLADYCDRNEDTRLIIIDTLQKIRDAENEKYSYGKDYEVITRLKQFSDQRNVCILMVHHTRKMDSSDSFEMISGTNGLLGAADGAFVLKKRERTDSEATMEITGRDQPDQKLTLEFEEDHCLWKMIKAEKGLHEHQKDPVLMSLKEVLEGDGWEGSPTELFGKMEERLPGRFKNAVALSKYLNPRVTELYQDFGIQYRSYKEHAGRRIQISFVKKETGSAEESNDEC